MPTPRPIKVRKIAILGSRSVGKSSCTLQFMAADQQASPAAPATSGPPVSPPFTEAYYPTVEVCYTKSLRFHGQEYQCEVIDTAGQDEHSILPSKHVLNIHGYVLVYSIASRPSFGIVKIIRDKILDMLGVDHVPIVLVGNKADLAAARQVSAEEGAALATSWGCSFLEVSAKTNLNIQQVFELELLEIAKAEGEPLPPSAMGAAAGTAGGTSGKRTPRECLIL